MRALAARLDGPVELVKPRNQPEVVGKSDAEILRYLAENPNSVRRPIIDTGKELILGFTSASRAKLGG